jgi:hypothetical protein
MKEGALVGGDNELDSHENGRSEIIEHINRKFGLNFECVSENVKDWRVNSIQCSVTPATTPARDGEFTQQLVLMSNNEANKFIALLAEYKVGEERIDVRLKSLVTQEVLFSGEYPIDFLGSYTDDPPSYQDCYDNYAENDNLAQCINCVTDVFQNEDLINLATELFFPVSIAIASAASCLMSEMGSAWTSNDLVSFVDYLNSVSLENGGEKFSDWENLESSIVVYLK